MEIRAQPAAVVLLGCKRNVCMNVEGRAVLVASLPGFSQFNKLVYLALAEYFNGVVLNSNVPGGICLNAIWPRF